MYVADTSVLLGWLLGQPGFDAADRLFDAHRDRSGREIQLLDLALHETGNCLARRRRWSAVDIARELDDVQDMFTVIATDRAILRVAARVAAEHELTFYDAAHVAAARVAGADLLTADVQILNVGLGLAVGDADRV